MRRFGTPPPNNLHNLSQADRANPVLVSGIVLMAENAPRKTRPQSITPKIKVMLPSTDMVH